MEEGSILRNNYRIERLIGRGGMADVYLAFDARRQTHVALKVLRSDFSEDADFVRRFSREAEALAKLDHPNIVRFYSFERQGAVAFIVMDYIQGSSLQRRIAESDGPLPLDEITDILHQAGAALQYAHGEGYVHRDIKPGNIMLRDNGEVLLSDFGIARAAESATAATVAAGTPAYMSPEQILGQEVDRRTDVYSLGVVLYELATGRRPFTGDERGVTGTSTLARLRDAHLKLTPPDPRAVNAALPPALAEVILRALAKEPAARYQDVRSLVAAWERAVGRLGGPTAAIAMAETELASPATPRTPTPAWTPTPAGPPTPPPAQKRGRNLWPLIALIGVLGLVCLAILVWQLALAGKEPAAPAPTADAQPTPAAILPTSTTAGAAETATAAAEATVQALVAAGVRQTATALYVAQPTATTVLPSATPAPSATPLPEIRCSVVYTGTAGMNMRAGPGQAYEPPLGQIPKDTLVRPLAYNAQGLPSGSWALVQVQGSGELGWVRAGEGYLDCDGDITRLPSAAAPPTPAPGETPATVAPTQKPSPAAATPTPSATATAQPAVAPRALLAYTVTEKFRDHYLVRLINSDGSGGRLLADRASEPSFSPDGKQVVFFAWPGGLDVMGVDGSGRRTILNDGEAAFPAWSPDGKWISFHSVRASRFDVYVIRPDGRDERTVADGEQASWSPNSQQLVYKGCLGNDCGLMIVNLDGSGKRRLTFSPNDGNADWSRDTNRIVFTSERDGNHEVYVVNPNGSGLTRLTNSPGPDAMPVWLPGGQQIAFRSARDGAWGIWIMNADGSGVRKLTDAKVDPDRWIWEKMAATRR